MHVFVHRDARRSILLALVTVAVAGCAVVDEVEPPTTEPTSSPGAASGGRGDVGEWLSARGLDLIDLFSLRIGVGPGLLAHARVTEWIALGAGSMGRPESWAGGFELRKYGLGWCRREGGLWSERRAELGISTFYYCETDAAPLGGNRMTFPPDSRGRWDVGIEAHLALIGAAAEVRLDEILDFVVGLAGFDPSHDDPSPAQPSPDASISFWSNAMIPR